MNTKFKEYLRENKILILFLLFYLVNIICRIFFPVSYFSNPELDSVDGMNDILSDFIYSVPLLLFIVGIMVFDSKTRRLNLFLLFFLCIAILRDVIEGGLLIANTKDFFKPEISTFLWSSKHEFNLYFNPVETILYVLPLVFYFLMFFKDYKSKVKERNELKKNLSKYK